MTDTALNILTDALEAVLEGKLTEPVAMSRVAVAVMTRVSKDAHLMTHEEFLAAVNEAAQAQPTYPIGVAIDRLNAQRPDGWVLSRTREGRYDVPLEAPDDERTVVHHEADTLEAAVDDALTSIRPTRE